MAWEPRIARINSIWPIIERHTVVNKLRLGALQSIPPVQLIDIQNWALENRQECLIVAQEGTSQNYTNASIPYEADKPWNYRVYLGRDSIKFMKAWKNNNDFEIAQALGYPDCCANFFNYYWTQEGWRDLTYAMNNFEPGVVDGPPTCNILLRHIGIRPVFHLPCKFNCHDTGILGKNILESIDQLGYTRELEWLYEMLNWPIRWSSLHGVVMITTPCFKIIASTDSLASVAVIDRKGAEYPQEGAFGNHFPFYQPGELVKFWTKDNWTDNGFSSRGAMRAAHDVVLQAFQMILLTPGKVLDLGCGNGLLLDKICEQYEFLEPIGVEINPGRANKARARLKTIYETDVADVESYKDNYEIILISLNRLKELDSPDYFLKKLRAHTRFLIIYSYEDWNSDKVNPEQEFDLVRVVQDKGLEARIYKSKI